MASPVSGPFLRERLVSQPGLPTHYDYFDQQQRWKQRRPFDLSLPFERKWAKVLRRDGDITSVDTWRIPLNADNATKIAAYEKFKGSFGDKAAVAVSLLEADQSIKMIRQRALQLSAFAYALRRGRVGDAVRALGGRWGPKDPKVFTKKNFANQYLEAHFGWIPLVSDIYSAVDVLQNPFNDVAVFGSKTSDWEDSVKNPPGSGQQSYFTVAELTVRYGAKFRIDNPNLYLANQLGLTNPVVWAVEKIPFSFVLDWFVNLNQFLELGTDFMGATLVDPYTTYYHKGITHFYWADHNWSCEVEQGWINRSQGIDGPSFGLRPFKLWGWRRAAAAVSLLVQRTKG